jgi:thiamine-phosphate pyrophosphorylase
MAKATSTERKALSRISRSFSRSAVSSLILVTDDTLAADWIAAAKMLPRGAAVILRVRHADQREELARRAIAALRPRGIKVVIAADWKLAWRLRADGVHFSEAQIPMAIAIKSRWPKGLVTVAAHGAKGLVTAQKNRADMALLSAAFATSSHPGREPLGPVRWAMARAGARLPVGALGGVSADNAKRIKAAGASALAVISAWIK